MSLYSQQQHYEKRRTNQDWFELDPLSVHENCNPRTSSSRSKSSSRTDGTDQPPSQTTRFSQMNIRQVLSPRLSSDVMSGRKGEDGTAARHHHHHQSSSSVSSSFTTSPIKFNIGTDVNMLTMMMMSTTTSTTMSPFERDAVFDRFDLTSLHKNEEYQRIRNDPHTYCELFDHPSAEYSSSVEIRNEYHRRKKIRKSTAFYNECCEPRDVSDSETLQIYPRNQYGQRIVSRPFSSSSSSSSSKRLVSYHSSSSSSSSSSSNQSSHIRWRQVVIPTMDHEGGSSSRRRRDQGNANSIMEDDDSSMID